MTDQPLSIDIGLEQGAYADLKILAEAVLDLHATASEIAYLMEPGLELRITLKRGKTGSLRLQTVIRALTPSRETLKFIAISIVVTLLSDAKSYLVSRSMEEIEAAIRDEDAEQQLSDADVDRIAKAVAQAMKSPSVELPKRRFYRRIAEDAAVTGIGASTNHDRDPVLTVPRSQFADRAEPLTETVEDAARRTTTREVDILLLSPFLSNKKRRWKFALDGLEFGAAILDQDFLMSVLTGRAHIEMAAGVMLGVTMELREEYHDGAWTVTERNIVKVHSVTRAPQQEILPFVSDDQDHDEQ